VEFNPASEVDFSMLLNGSMSGLRILGVGAILRNITEALQKLVKGGFQVLSISFSGRLYSFFPNLKSR
jgi:hypothetical protein